MPRNPSPLSSSYTSLLTAIHTDMHSGLAAAQRALEYQRLRTYWVVGRKLNAYIARFPGEAQRGNAFFRRVSRDLQTQTGMKITADTLVRTAQFHRAYPKFPTRTPLTFTHYLALLRVHDPQERRRLEEQAVRQGWGALTIKQEISLRRIGAADSPEAREPLGSAQHLKVERGDPFIYALSADMDINGQRVVEIDCGFKIFHDIPDGNSHLDLKPCIVRSVKTGPAYHLVVSNKLRVRRYTYPARIRRVVDGDTIDARVDAGFGIRVNERFRLKGINTPEISSSDGQRAKIFLERFFADHPRVIIRSVKTGVYGRWLADIFVMDGEFDPMVCAREGQYLNQVLLDEGLASLY